VGRYQKGKTNLDFTEARDSEWHWHQLGYTQVCTSLQADNHASTPPPSFLQTGCPSCRSTNSVMKTFLRFYSHQVFNVLYIFECFIIKENIYTNLTQNSTLMIF